jgi:hypothetical protein
MMIGERWFEFLEIPHYNEMDGEFFYKGAIVNGDNEEAAFFSLVEERVAVAKEILNKISDTSKFPHPVWIERRKGYENLIMMLQNLKYRPPVATGVEHFEPGDGALWDWSN